MKKTNNLHCLICKKKIDAEVRHYPFCSIKCSKIDLGRWFGEEYYFLDSSKKNNS